MIKKSSDDINLYDEFAEEHIKTQNDFHARLPDDSRKVFYSQINFP
jgi:hypothetical protein